MAERVKAMITGASGAVGTALRQHLQALGWAVVPWDRTAVSLTDPPDMHSYLETEFPDVLFHLATASQPTGLPNESWVVNVEWSEQLARHCRQLGIRMLFTSSVMVFTDEARGPFTIESAPDARSGYGHEKHMAERRVMTANPHAIVARLGWQIGEAPGSNNMIDFLTRQMEKDGEVKASRRWYPATSFVADTAVALANLAQNGRGLYLLDGNERWSFWEITTALNAQRGSPWRINPTDDFVYDQRMQDPRVGMPPLRERLPALT